MGLITVENLMRELKLSVAASEVNDVVASSKSNINFDWITELLQREIDARKEKRLQMRLKRSKMPEIKCLERFNWSFNPQINKGKIEDLCSLDFIRDRDIVLFLGQPGTGKSHIAGALGVKAVYAGYSVQKILLF